MTFQFHIQGIKTTYYGGHNNSSFLFCCLFLFKKPPYFEKTYSGIEQIFSLLHNYGHPAHRYDVLSFFNVENTKGKETTLH